MADDVPPSGYSWASDARGYSSRVESAAPRLLAALRELVAAHDARNGARYYAALTEAEAAIREATE